MNDALHHDISGAKVHEILGTRLLSSQKVILFTLEAAQRPVTLREIMEVLKYPWPVNRRTVQRPIEYLISQGTVSLDKSATPHRYSLRRAA